MSRAAEDVLQSSVVYTLPEPFLASLRMGERRPAFKAPRWAAELEISLRNGDHSVRIGFINGHPLTSSMLVDPDFSVGVAEYLRTANLSATAFQDAVQQARRVRRNQRAYCGWLMTSRQFLTEHSEVWKSLRPLAISDSAMPRPVTSGFATFLEGFEAPREDRRLSQLRDHCARWRLSHLTGPYVPEPLAFQSPAPLPQLAAEQAASAGFGLTVIPDTMPLPARDELRTSISGAREAIQSDHLASWRKIISSESRTKEDQLDRYSRIFVVQHLYSVLLSRHADALRGKVTYVRQRIADFLNVDEKTVQRDFALLAREGGAEWWKRAF